MPWIDVPVPKKKKKKRLNHSTKSNSLIHRYVYNTRRWRDLRIDKLRNNPLCECDECKKSGKLKLALDVHHIIPISTAGNDIQMIKKLGFSYSNLLSVNPECHKQIHLKIKLSELE